VLYRNFGRNRVGGQTAPTLPELYRGLHEEAEPEDVLVIPHAHQAGDWTRSDRELERLVEIYSMHGGFEWFANRYLGNGFRVGFIGASDDHRARPGYAHGIEQLPLGQWGGLVAVRSPRLGRDPLFDALRELSVYATSGPRILMDATLNGAAMGSWQPATHRREIRARVSGTAAIDHVDVIRNGEVVYSRHYLAAPLAPRCWIQVSFESTSEVIRGSDNPRPYRPWEGRLRVVGADLLQARSSGLGNIYREWAVRQAEKPQTVSFRVETRGRRDVLLLELAEAGRGTRLDVELAATRERGYTQSLVRRPAELPARKIQLSFADLADGRLEARVPVGGHVDRVRLQIVDLAADLDREFEFTDLAPPHSDGDYYYVRITQIDGERAWSSPFWIGEGRSRGAVR
jgi:hypothetical protein